MSLFSKQDADPESVFDALVAGAAATRVTSVKRGQYFAGRDVELYAAKHLGTLNLRLSAAQRRQLAACGTAMEVSPSSFLPLLDKLVMSVVATGVYKINHEIKRELAQELKCFGMPISFVGDAIHLNDDIDRRPLDEVVVDIKADLIQQAANRRKTADAAPEFGAMRERSSSTSTPSKKPKEATASLPSSGIAEKACAAEGSENRQHIQGITGRRAAFDRRVIRVCLFFFFAVVAILFFAISTSPDAQHSQSADAATEIPSSIPGMESGLIYATRELAAKVNAGEIKTASMETVMSIWKEDIQIEQFMLADSDAMTSTAVAMLEQSNRWWITGVSNIYLRLANSGRRPVTGVLFSISDTTCDIPPSKKRYFLFRFLQPLKSGMESVYLGSIQMDYHANFGEGVRCGIVEKAFTTRRK